MSKKKLIWAIDCDDVIIATAEVLVNAYNERYGTLVSLGEFYTKDAQSWGVSSGGDGTKRVSDLIREGILADIAPSQETVDALKKLASLDELHMVTGRQSFLEETTHRMIDRYLPGVFTTVEHTNYFIEEGSTAISRSKGEVCAAIGADILIDDHVDHGRSVLEYGLKEVIVWGGYPWSRTQILERGMVRCASWEEVFRERERILASRK